MVPGKQHETWRALATGKLKHDFKCVPAGMLLSRVARSYAKDPASLPTLIDEVHDFFVRYASVLKDDMPRLFK